MITNYAPKLYKQYEKEYKKNGLSLENTKEKQTGFLSRPNSSAQQDSLSSKNTAFELWADLRNARNRLRAEKEK